MWYCESDNLKNYGAKYIVKCVNSPLTITRDPLSTLNNIMLETLHNTVRPLNHFCAKVAYTPEVIPAIQTKHPFPTTFCK